MEYVEFPLERTERQLWSGVPEGRRFSLGPRDTGSVVLSVFVGIMWIAAYEAMFDGERPNVQLAAILFGAGALGILGAVLRRRWILARTNYCITTERVMIRKASKIESIYLVELHSVLLREHGDGSGTIRLGDDLAHSTGGEGVTVGGVSIGVKGGRYGVELAPRIADVANVRKVYRILEDARAAAHKASAPK